MRVRSNVQGTAVTLTVRDAQCRCISSQAQKSHVCKTYDRQIAQAQAEISRTSLWGRPGMGAGST